MSLSRRLAEISRDLEQGEQSPVPTVREFLGWAGAERRGVSTVAQIRKELDENNLVTLPDFESAYIDSPIQFGLADAVEQEEQETELGKVISEAAADTPRFRTGSLHTDPAYRLSKLEAANDPPVSVKPDENLQVAITKMLTYGYSQLPVMTSEREVKGVVTWAGIGSRLSLRTCTSDQPVRDFMDPHCEIRSNASMFEAISLVVKHDYVLVRAADKKITGVLTASDISLQFRQLTEPFLILGEIENNIRRMIDQRFSPSELMHSAADPDDTGRTIESVADLTFGEYIRLLQKPCNWQRLNLHIDRQTFVESLDSIRVIRNDIMHFDPDGIPGESLEVLRSFSSFLHKLNGLQAV